MQHPKPVIDTPGGKNYNILSGKGAVMIPSRPHYIFAAEKELAYEEQSGNQPNPD